MVDYNSNLIEIERPQNADTLRLALIANAYSIINVAASNPNTKQIFEDLLGPSNGPFDLNRPFKVYQKNGKWITEGVSTCGLVARGLWRRMNVDMPALYKPYISGTAVSSIVEFAKKNGAWQTNKGLDLRPNPADCVIVGENLNTHVLTAINWGDGNNPQLISVDGGRTDSTSLQCIEKVSRDWVQKSSGNLVQSFLGTRIVQGWAVFDLLPFKGSTIIVPENWESTTI